MPTVPAVIACAGFYAAACALLLAPIFNFRQMTTASFGGDARLILWTLAWDNHAVLDRVASFWNANMFYPAPNALAYSEHLAGISLFTLPVYALTRNPVLAYNVAWLLAFWLTAIAMHLVAWRHTRDHLASAVAGLIGAFCFYRMHQGHGHLHMVWVFWIPFSLLAIEHWMRVRRWGSMAALTAVIVLQALASWYQAVLIALVDLVYFGWLLSTEGERGLAERAPGGDAMPRGAAALSALRALAPQALAGAAVAAAVVWPFARHYSILSPALPADAAGYAADLAGYLIPPQNTIAGRWLLAHGVQGPRWIWGEATVYLGWIALVLAGAGALVAVARPEAIVRRHRVFVIIAAVGVMFGLGPSQAEVAAATWGWSPFGLLMRLPGINLFRVPARFTELVMFAVALLAALACARLHVRWPRAGRVATACLIPLLLLDYYVVDFPGGPPASLRVPAIYRLLAQLPPHAVVSLPDYAGTAEFFIEPDYQYFSTANWLPIANGFSRAEPPGFRPLMDRLVGFPADTSAAAMREVGIGYVVVHARSLRDRAPDLLARARASADFTLISVVDDVYLFGVR